MNSIDISRQRYLDMIHRFLKGRLSFCAFRSTLPSLWAEEREELWLIVWQSTRTQRCSEFELLAKGELPRAEPSDPRRLCRMLDRLCNLCILAKKERAFRSAVEELLAVYCDPKADQGAARFIAYPPHIPVFKRPLPGGRKHQYPCPVEDIRRQLALVPEYDLEGLHAIGLCPCGREKRNTYATYYRNFYPMRKPVIVIHSDVDGFQYKLCRRDDPGYIKQSFRVEHDYGVQIDRRDHGTFLCWSAENARRFLVEHVLLHEIGHHVQYQERWRAQHRRWLPSKFQEQFADDYAIRFHREFRE